MTLELGDYLTAINSSKEPLMDEGEQYIKMNYPAFVVTRCLSYFPDTLFASNEMNTRPHIDPKMHFDFLRLTIRPRKRFSKWLKREQDGRVLALSQYYGFSAHKAREAIRMISTEDMDAIIKIMSTGGKK